MNISRTIGFHSHTDGFIHLYYPALKIELNILHSGIFKYIIDCFDVIDVNEVNELRDSVLGIKSFEDNKIFCILFMKEEFHFKLREYEMWG